MMEIDRLAQRAQAMYQRLNELYSNVNGLPSSLPDVLPQALMELGSASQMVELATEELYTLNEQLLETRHSVELERQRYQSLFNFAPDGYLLIDIYGKIYEANLTAAKCLNISQQHLIDKVLINFVVLEQRHRFRNFLLQFSSESSQPRDLPVRLQKYGGEIFDATFTIVSVPPDEQNQLETHPWLLCKIADYQQVKITLSNTDYDFGDRPTQQHCKGETIPLERQTIWYVKQGFVKLSTLCETGEEVLVGLASPGMVFGSELISLSIYQAIALSDVELVAIHQTELKAFPILKQTLFPKIMQRLWQTEHFLAISGSRRVKDRFYYLLQFLKREAGEPVADGTRLRIRLTHEELASTCCTTRVTITRLMCKFQKEGLICLDHKNHIIIKD